MFFISKARRVFLYSKVYLPNLTWGFSKKNTAQNPNGSSSPNKSRRLGIWWNRDFCISCLPFKGANSQNLTNWYRKMAESLPKHHFGIYFFFRLKTRQTALLSHNPRQVFTSINLINLQSWMVTFQFFESWLIHHSGNPYSSWWFQPIWKILVELDHFPK